MRAIDEDAAASSRSTPALAVVDAPPAQAFAPIRRIGGGTGWYFADALCGGCADGSTAGWAERGMPRHRRDPDDCVVGDVIDGWRVEAYEPDRLLRLGGGTEAAGARLARVPRDAARRRSAIADPPDGDLRSEGRGGPTLLVRVLPLHALVFRGLLRRIARRAGLARRARLSDVHVLLDHRRASSRGVPLARAAGRRSRR